MRLFKRFPYLTRCRACRRLILITDTRCAHCQTPAADLPKFAALTWLNRRIVLPLILGLVVLALLVLALDLTLEWKQRERESERARREGGFP